MATTITTLDGSTISATINGITPHSWTVDANGVFQTTADLQGEWTAAYATMLAGNGASLTPLQRIEGNAEAVFENTKFTKLSAASQAMFRADTQREFDAISAAMTINQTLYGINPNQQFNTYTYLMMEKTLQSNEQLVTLAVQGHGLNSPTSTAYDGYTTDFQNKTDGTTFYVGGGIDNGENAISAFFDDVSLSHAPFVVVQHNGVAEQLNQNGNLEDPLSTVITATNADMFTRVFVASDFSTNAGAVGANVSIIGAAPAAPALPVAPAGSITTLDGSVISGTINGLTAHQWTVDGTGTFVTLTDLRSEWIANYQAMQAGQGNLLTPLQRMEGNAEAVLENTNANNIPVATEELFRQDLQREFDAIDAAMRMNKVTYGIDPTQQFTTYSYQMMEDTLRNNETLQELATQGHGLNTPTLAKYDGYTTDFQNKVDGMTYYVGGGGDNGELAISAFLDDVVLTHAPFDVVQNNGTATQLNQNGNQEDPLATQVAGANETAFTRVFVPGDFSTNSLATGPVVLVPPSANTILVTDVTTGQSSTAAPTVYSGPVAGLQWQFLDLSPDNLSIAATMPNNFLHSGAGSDALSVAAVGGINVLDGGTGSNFLVGGTGVGSQDTFFVDDRSPAADIWTTVVNFHAGDGTTIFGLTAQGFGTSWVDGQGAAGFTGLTLHATAGGKPTASLTLAGFSTADMASGRIQTTFGTEVDGTPYLYVVDVK